MRRRFGSSLKRLIQAIPELLLFEPFAWLDGRLLGPGVWDDFTPHLREEHEPLIRAWLDKLG